MRKGISIILYIIMMLFECCEISPNDINRENINNPQVYVTEDSVFEYRYYLTTEQGGLATSFFKKENIIVHLDIKNRNESEVAIDGDASNPMYYECATCYDKQDNVISDMSYTPLCPPMQDSVNIKIIRPNEEWKHTETFKVKIRKGEYYYKATPVLMIVNQDKVGSSSVYKQFSLQIPFVIM